MGAARHVMANTVIEMQRLKRVLAETEAALSDAEERRQLESKRRIRAEKERNEALALAQKMRKERDVALQKAVAANERLKEGVGNCLSLSMTQTTEQSRLQQSMQTLEDKFAQKEREITNLMQTQNGGQVQTQTRSPMRTPGGTEISS